MKDYSKEFKKATKEMINRLEEEKRIESEERERAIHAALELKKEGGNYATDFYNSNTIFIENLYDSIIDNMKKPNSKPPFMGSVNISIINNNKLGNSNYREAFKEQLSKLISDALKSYFKNLKPIFRISVCCEDNVQTYEDTFLNINYSVNYTFSINIYLNLDL